MREPWRRLGRFWGRVDEGHCRLILHRLKGKRILAVGCGYGSFVHFLNRRAGFLAVGDEVVGVDVDERALEVARRLHPGSRYVACAGEELEFPDGHFSTVVFKETLHHIVGEYGADAFLVEVVRVLEEGGRVVVFDPNPNLLLRAARRIAFHRDAECSPAATVKLLEKHGFEVKSIGYSDILALPLSGGYIGPDFVPDVPFIQRAVLRADGCLCRLVNRLGLGRRVLWRYLVAADRGVHEQGV